MRAATASRGFYASIGVERDDVFLFVFDEGTSAAGVFTRSFTASDDVQWCRKALENGDGHARALLVNSGNSNAFTGPAGALKNAASRAALCEVLLVPETACFLAATGVIGQPISDPNYVGALVPDLAGALSAPNWEACARSFMTTDTYPKGAGTTTTVDGSAVSFVGIAKGSGMIAPNMATMLAYIFTDAAIAPPVLQELIKSVTDHSFNAITVDGDTSTSDTFMVFATGRCGMDVIKDLADPRIPAIRRAVADLANELALQIAKDGEGISKFVGISVSGAASNEDAKAVAARIANSPLVKTALAAGDANWGRIVMAAGNADVAFDQTELSIWFGDHQVADQGAQAIGYDEAIASSICAGDTIDIRISIGSGPGNFTVYTCDLTHAYIDINGAYRT